MSEREAVEASDAPRTRASLGGALRTLGLTPGEVLLAHVSMRSLGWVCGREVALLEALLDALGEEGTLVMPAFSSDLTEPRHWRNPPVPEAWWPTVRETMAAYDPARTPTLGLGRAAETFRSWPGVRRSRHPCSSFAALGPAAAALVAGHSWDHSLGEGSPLGRLAERQARVLLLGVGFERCTAFHLGEDRAGVRPVRDEGGPVLEGGRRVWRRYRNPAYDDEEFATLGAAFEATGVVTRGAVGSATARLFSLAAAADFAEAWLRGAVG